ncbi:MAG: hypothetical protein GY941_04695 [Planctomycetes bacterium]|nr:hypothetical protein [Planctomycetota bacterium]
MRNIIKSFYIASLSVLFVLNCAGLSSAASMLEDLNNFQESLSGWVEKIEQLENRSSAVEKDLEIKDQQLSEINNTLSSIEGLLSKLDSRVTKVQNMRSVEGVKKALQSFDDALDIFKKRFAEMAKRLEDYEVKVSVLEKVYATAQNPVETVVRELDKQQEIINALSEKVDTQNKSLFMIKEDVNKNKTPSEDLEHKIEEFHERLADLESGTVMRKKDTVVHKGHGTETKGAPSHTADAHDTEAKGHEVTGHESGHKTDRHDTAAHKQDSHEMVGYIDIGMGFFIKDLKFASFGSSCRAGGEMVNKSETYYSTADFVIRVFNNVGKQLGGQDFSIIGFGQRQSKIFDEILTGVNEEEITNYTLYYAKMPSLLARGEGELKMFEREHKGLVTEEAERDLHKENRGEKEEPKVSKGYEDIGNGFSVENVTFSGFGSSSSVVGVIQNHSGADINRASFLMKVFSKEYGLITTVDFSVRHIPEGGSKEFEEIIAGVRPTEIDRHEVTFKDSY